MIWTEEMKETLRTMGADGVPYGKIAKHMNSVFGTELTKNSMIGMAQRLKVPRREPICQPVVKAVKQVTIYDLKENICKWPLGEVAAVPPYFYCGKPTGLGCSYCKVHSKMSYSKTTSDSAKIYLPV